MGPSFLLTFSMPLFYKSLSLVGQKQSLLGSMNWSLNHNSALTVVTIDQ